VRHRQSHVISWILRLYPRRWRSQYFDATFADVDDLIRHGRPFGSIATNLLFGALLIRLVRAKNRVGLSALVAGFALVVAATIQAPRLMSMFDDYTRATPVIAASSWQVAEVCRVSDNVEILVLTRTPTSHRSCNSEPSSES